MQSTDVVSHRHLRSYATFLVVLGWVLVLLCTLIGFAPWLAFGGFPVPTVPSWERWILSAAPALGLLAGALGGLGCFVLSGVIRVLLDQRDLLEDILRTQRRSLRAAESPQPSAPPVPPDPFDLAGIKDRDEPVL
jgi:hypothetical protein